MRSRTPVWTVPPSSLWDPHLGKLTRQPGAPSFGISRRFEPARPCLGVGTLTSPHFPPHRSGNSGRSPLLVVPGHLGPTGEACPALLETSILSVINPLTPSWCVVWCHHFLDSKHILGGWGSPAFAGASAVGTVTGHGDMTMVPLGISLGWACSQHSDCCLRCVLQVLFKVSSGHVSFKSFSATFGLHL